MGVLDDAAGFANPYGVSSQGEWNLVRGVFTNVNGVSMVFFYEKPTKGETGSNRTAIDNINDNGGRRLAVYEYPYLDGQAVEDLGRKGETFTFSIKFHGSNYQLRFADFINQVVNTRGTGTLSHPVRGAVRCRFRDWDFTHKYDEWNAVSIKATFIEDNTGQLASTNYVFPSATSSIRSLLQTICDSQAAISARLAQISAVLLLPAALEASLQARLNSITGQISRLTGQLAATFSTDSSTAALGAQAVANSTSIVALSDGTTSATQTTGGTATSSVLPPTFQVGFDPATQAVIQSQLQSFVSANTITPQQAVTSANAARAQLTTAIGEVTSAMGNQGYDIVLQYRGLGVAIQQAVEASISSSLSKVKVYVTPSPMSLRMIAFNNGLLPERQNDIEQLNPYLASINYVPAGTAITVPAS